MNFPDPPSRFYRQHRPERGILATRIGNGALGIEQVLAVEQEPIGAGDMLCGYIILRRTRLVEFEAHELHSALVQYVSHQFLDAESCADRTEIGRAPLL